ncbi:MAG: DUF2247 family protein [Cyanobacteria bacterium P01_A01_bin.40]
MIDDILQRLEQQKLVDWGVILQGWKDIPGCNLRIRSEYIENFAFQKVEKYEGDILDIVIELTSIKFLDSAKILILLEEMCNEEKIDLEISMKKWRLAMLEEILDNLSNDCLYDLIELSDFWISWGTPSDKPHLIQRLDSKLNPTEYYSEKNYQKTLEAHKIWIEQEKYKIHQSRDR